MNSAHSHSVTVEGAPPECHHMDVPTAYQSAKLGMWLSWAQKYCSLAVCSLLLLFIIGGILQKSHYADKNLDWRLGSLNTAGLPFSSFTAALAVDAAQHGNNKKVFRNLSISIICGFLFLGIKYIEWSSKYHHGLFPGTEFFNSTQDSLRVQNVLRSIIV